ncbi:MAG: YajD family HNH nuclease [Acidobacteriota bacterium]
MSSRKTSSGTTSQDQLLEQIRRSREQREKSYRAQALKMFPWICARCGREFSGKRIRELTVHHKDHNHDNNPPDGSNWELLCLHCHENEHSRLGMAEAYGGAQPTRAEPPSSTYKPFALLEDLLKRKK